MQRRIFSAGLATLATSGSILSTRTWAQQSPAPQSIQPIAGQDYRVLQQPVRINVPAGKVGVIDFFGYWCPHCNAFEPRLQQWEKTKPDFIAMTHVPVPFGPAGGVPYQKLYYTLLQMGVLSKLHDQVFATYHVQRKSLNSDEALIAWAKSHGLNQETFTKVLNSFGVQNSVRRANLLTRQYGVEGIPSMGVAGKYYIDTTLAKNMNRMLLITQALATQVYKQTQS